jgi:hypothetical protein
MALHDNKLWLLSHIHNSFVSSDDTGVCEMVLGTEDFKAELKEVAKHQVPVPARIPAPVPSVPDPHPHWIRIRWTSGSRSAL